ncbi:hypothetical protein A1O1_02056 [Capronia coronata CBS 617.96]|uniref:Uncharacterized protein n=1 Tax=Capronia coronata CBS 617.96 TaxID=1182541 RepID=W9ZGN0_9EURO|nr:uncharacterized protein A1O1_02056 [Capronia coronata CBS 617.96]EXJ93664.1 hypothetical protein A1O1_02056 [Capronia coronata CBS 617.96]
MSQGTTERNSDTQKSPKTQRDIIDLTGRLDQRLHHLRESVLPRQPYLLSVPSDVPYRHSSRFVNTWYEGTPFGSEEEQIQYVSFLPHQGEHEALLKVEGGWADEEGNFIQEELSPKTVPASGRNTPAEVGHRKKISLKDYKTKGKGSPETTFQSQPSQEGKTEVTESSKVEGIPSEPTEAPEPKKQEKAVSPKPSVTTQDSATAQTIPSLDGAASPPSRPGSHLRSPPYPVKRRKLSPLSEEPEAEERGSNLETQPPVMKMPTLLSPTLPSPEKENDLPQLLSPVLPPSLAKAISTSPSSASIGSPAMAPHHRTDPVRSILARAELDQDPFSEKNAVSLGGSRVRSDSQHSARSSAPGTPNAARVALGTKLLSKAGVRVGTPLHNGARASPGPRQRHTIILKYGKKNRKRVEALLKLGPRSKKERPKREAVDGQATPEVRSGKANVPQQTVRPQQIPKIKTHDDATENVKTEKKRKAEDSPGSSLKKVKTSKLTVEVEKRPTTPVPLNGKTSFSTQPRSAFSTPKREMKSTAMRRVESSDALDVPTPSGDRGRVSTPLAVPKPSPQPPASLMSREEERQQWTSLNNKFFALGRSLKHEGSSMLPSSDGDAKPDQSAKAVLVLIEALLCFMINIAAQCQARPGVDPGWRSIILYHIFVFRASRKFPHLHGLVVQLGAVCRQYIQKYDMDRLARDPLPEDYCNSAPTPGSDGNTKTNEDSERYKKRYVEFRDDLIHNARELQTAWLDGSRYLSIDLLRREYPNTWAKRNQDTSLRLQEKLSPLKINKDFYLPMDTNTTAFEAARFGVSFLEEWAEKEKIDWRPRIEL